MKEILLTQSKVALVDDADYERASKLSWYAERRNHTWYARAGFGNGKRKYLHQFILGRKEIDHFDSDGLNCQRDNLRPCNRSQNGANHRLSKNNLSGVKGASWDTRKKNWFVKITVERKQIFLGNFKDLDEAAKAYDRAAVKYFGEFARLNFPD